MRLRKIEIFGFKTFPEKTTLHFEPGITCIVGPNGCGKSNVVDAILWVMGEQSTKTLRGEKMEDVIFFGSEGRKTLGMAEVTLTIGDIKGELPSQYSGYSEIEITRRLFRSGESEYLINKVSSRLRDIKDILIDAGIGFKGHTVIEQGRVERILTSTPEERRAIIEDTAGIMKYKFRKTEALRKLEATQHNLLRVRDIISEVKRQISSLDRQVRKAREYQDLAGQIREQEIALYACKYTALEDRLKELLRREDALREREMEIAAEVSRIEAESEETKGVLAEEERGLGHLRQSLFNIDKEISGHENRLILIENEMTHQREEKERLVRDISSLKEDLASMRTASESFNMEKAIIEGKLTEGEASILEEERRFESASQEFHDLQESLENARTRAFGIIGKITEAKNRQTTLQSRVSELGRMKERTLAEKGDGARVISETLTQGKDKEEVKKGLKERLDEKIRLMTSLSDKLASTENAIGELTERLNKKREALHRGEARLHSLEEMEKNLIGYQEGVRSILLSKAKEEAPFSGVRGMVADFIDVLPQGNTTADENQRDTNVPPIENRGVPTLPEGFSAVPPIDRQGFLTLPEGFSPEKVIEAVLGERLQNLVVEDHEETKRALEFLKSNSAGRTTFIPVNPRRDTSHISNIIGNMGSVPSNGVIGPALSFVEVKEGYKSLAEYLLADVIVVDTLDTALSLLERNDNGFTYVTLGGDVVEPGGRVTGGISNGKSQGLIEKRRELRSLQNDVLRLKQEVSDLEGELERLKREEEGCKSEIEGVHNHIRSIEMSIVNIEKDIEILKDEERRLQLRIETLSLEEREIDAEIQTIASELNSYDVEIQGFIAEQAAEEQRIQELIETQKLGREKWENSQREITARKLELATLREKKESLSTRLREIGERIEVAAGFIVEKEGGLHQIDQKTGEYISEKSRIESAIGDLWQKKESLSKEIINKEQERTGREERLRALEESIKEKQRSTGEIRREINQSEIQKAEIRLEMGHLKENIHGAYQVVLEEEIAKLNITDFRTEELEATLTGLKERLNRMGPVNLASIEEYQELNQRYEFLTHQESDLSQACDTLHKTISKINKTTREMFLSTFNIINEKFQRLFQLFFQGGNARLSLTDENNVLESGIEILAQPPGKKVSQLALLSGGEKALTALSLLFATFLARPTPFCVLDEIDAPLDESNTERFIRTLRDMTGFSQFIVITHNKRTMEAADTLYGVTMEEPGVSKLVSVNLSKRDRVEDAELVSASAT